MIQELWFEDFTPGQVIETAGVTLTEGMIIEFALVYDPQPVHLDRTAAEDSIFGGLIASGFQTLALSFRLLTQTGVMARAGLGGPGMDEVRWLRPVRPGDTLRARVTVTEAKPSRSKPDRGAVLMDLASTNQAGETVLTAKLVTFMRKRPA